MTDARLPLAAVALVIAFALSGCSGDDGTSASDTVPVAPIETTTTTEPPLEAGEQIFVYSPEVNDCFDRRLLEGPSDVGPQGQSEIVLRLDCDLPHRYEVFEVLDYPEPGPDHPGEDPMQAFARRECVVSFGPFVGERYEVSELEIGYYLPSPTEWDQGMRRIGCYLYDVAGESLVGSMRGSTR
jgi:hypothetical protein